MEEISKELYRNDKNTPLEVIRNPFMQLRIAIEDSKNREHPTVILVLNEIERVLGEFQELELILKTIPPIQPKSEHE